MVASVAKPFTSLSWFVIWQHSSTNVSNEGHSEGRSNETIYFNAVDGTFEDEKISRKVGLAQGVVDFSRMLSTVNQPVHAVHSSLQHMIFLEPETGYFIMACIDLALHSVAGPSHKRTATSGSDKAVPSEEGIEDEIYQGVLRRAYRHFKLLNGTFKYLQAQDTIREKCKTFFDEWIKSWRLEKSTLAEFSFPEHLSTLPGKIGEALQDRLEGFVSRTHISGASLFHDTRLIASSPSKDISPDTLYAFSTLVYNKLPPRPGKHASNQESSPKQQKTLRHSSSDTWKTSFGMGALSSYLAMPSFSNSSSTPAEATSAAQPSTAKNWSRVVTFGLYSGSSSETSGTATHRTKHNHSHPATETQIDPSDMAEAFKEESDSDSDDSVADHIAKLAEKKALAAEYAAGNAIIREQDVPFTTHLNDESESISDTDTSNTKKEVDLRQALPEDGSQVHNVQETIMSEVINIFDAEGHSHTAQKGEFCLALVCKEDQPESDSVSLESSVAEFLGSLQFDLPITETGLDYRFLVNRPSEHVHQGENWHAADGRFWSGSAAAAKEADVMGGLLEGQRYLYSKPRINEIFIRTGSSQWAILKKLDEGEVYMVVDKKVGKEGSLVDADNELSSILQQLDVV